MSHLTGIDGMILLLMSTKAMMEVKIGKPLRAIFLVPVNVIREDPKNETFST